MKISKLIIKNFRSFKQQKIFDINSNYVTFTGENNCGKSNVLRALNLFFNGIVDKNEFLSQTDMHLNTINEGSRVYWTPKTRPEFKVEKFNNTGVT